MFLQLWAVQACTVSSVEGQGLALRGPDGSMDKAVRSVLDANSDLEMLGFDSKAKPAANDVNHKFRELSRSVHPDKNKHPDASQAFQKLSAAKDRLLQEIQKREAAEEAKKRARAAAIGIQKDAHGRIIGFDPKAKNKHKAKQEFVAETSAGVKELKERLGQEYTRIAALIQVGPGSRPP